MAHPAVITSRFLEGAERQRAWATGLLVVAGLLWIYAAFELFTPYHADRGHCTAPFARDQDTVHAQYDQDSSAVFGSDDHEKAVACAANRDWPKPVAALVVALPLTAVGSSLMTAGTVGARVQRLIRDMEQSTS